MQPAADELSAFKRSKGTLQFPLTEPLPLKPIERIVRFCVQENEIKAGKKKKPGQVFDRHFLPLTEVVAFGAGKTGDATPSSG